MTTKKNRSSDEEFDPEKHKEIDKGPLKSEHKNQYRNTSDKITDRKLAERVPNKKSKD